MFSNSNASYQLAINELKLNNKQAKKKIINISINKAPTPVFQQKSINIVDNYKETSEKIKLMNFSKKRQTVNINLDESKHSHNKGSMNYINYPQPKPRSSMTTKNSQTIKINYSNNLANLNYLNTDIGENPSQKATNKSNNIAGNSNTNIFPKSYAPVATLNDSSTNSANMQITFTYRNYNNDTLSYLHNNSNSNYLTTNQTIADNKKDEIEKDADFDKNKIKLNLENDSNINRIGLNIPNTKLLKNNSSITDINKLIMNNNNPLNLNKKISSLLAQLNSNNVNNIKKISVPFHPSKIINNIKENSSANKNIIKNNFTASKITIDINNCNDHNSTSSLDHLKTTCNVINLNPYPLSTKNMVSKNLRDSNQFKQYFKDLKNRGGGESLIKNNSKSNSRSKIILQNEHNDSVDKLKSKFPYHIQNNKSLSIVNVKQKYKELMKNKSIPASLMIKSFKLSNENNPSIINSSKDNINVAKGNNLKEKICNKLKVINDAKNNKIGVAKNINLNEKKNLFEQEYKNTLNILKENITRDSISFNKNLLNGNEIKEGDTFDDMNTIVKRLKFHEINVKKENIFSENNFIYKNFEMKFNTEFENVMLPNFERKVQNYLSNTKSYFKKESLGKDKSISISTQDTSSKKHFSPTIFGKNYLEQKQGEMRASAATNKVNGLKVNLLKLK